MDRPAPMQVVRIPSGARWDAILVGNSTTPAISRSNAIAPVNAYPRRRSSGLAPNGYSALTKIKHLAGPAILDAEALVRHSAGARADPASSRNGAFPSLARYAFGSVLGRFANLSSILRVSPNTFAEMPHVRS
jgi:hypothetical protein